MKIIIAGAGEVGTYLAKMLYAVDHDITVIDNDEENLKKVDTHHDVMPIKGSATSIETLKEANIKGTDLLIAVTPIEEINMTSAALAKNLGAKKVIARINNHEYLDPLNRRFIHQMGIDSIVYPEILASREVVSMLKQTGTNKRFEFSTGHLSLYILKLDNAKSPMIGKNLIDVAKENSAHDYRTVAIIRNSETIIPKGQTVFELNDMAYVVTSHEGIQQLLKYSGKENFNIKNVMILGGSRIGKKVAKSIESKFNVKLLEYDKNKAFELADELDDTLVVNVDGTNIDILKQERVQDMDAFIAVTGNSETNILTCTLAKKFGVKKTIAEIENFDYMQVALNMGIDSVVNKKLIAASNIFSFTMSAEVPTVQCLTGTTAEALEMVVHGNSLVTKKPIKSIKFPDDALIGGVIRGNSSFIAKGDTRLQADDKVIVFALPTAINQVNQLFK